MNEASTITPEHKAPVLSAPLTSVQPGGGICYRLELLWGSARRWYLKTFRKGYIERMRQRRRGSTDGAPHEILDPRDLKYCRNQCTCEWDTADDPFVWRERIPLARWGLAEVQLMSYPLVAVALLCFWLGWPIVALLPLLGAVLVVYFFRDPPRRVPQTSGTVVAPADGRVVEITPLPHDNFLGGPAVRVGIFLSVFNVHINRAPVAARAVGFDYRPGKFLNALDPLSAVENESLRVDFEGLEQPRRRYAVRQIAGLLARRIVCGLRPGEEVGRGAKFGMIKLGSRTELILPDEDACRIVASVGQRVRAGMSVVAQWDTGEVELEATSMAADESPQ